jgi:hypothetical protein
MRGATTQRYMHLSPAAIEAAIRLLDQAKPVHRLGDMLETADREVSRSLPSSEVGLPTEARK